jgi:hypothetical protein
MSKLEDRILILGSHTVGCGLIGLFVFGDLGAVIGMLFGIGVVSLGIKRGYY